MSIKDRWKDGKQDMEENTQGEVSSKFSAEVTLLESNPGGIETV